MRNASLILLFLLLLPALVEGRTIAVDVPAGARGVAEALNDSWWIGWLRRENEGLALDVGPGARGEVRILVRPLPVDAAVAGLLAGLPVELGDGALKLGDTVYGDPRHTLAVRLPRAETPTWLVTGREAEGLAQLAGLLVMKEAGARMWGRGDEPFDYLLRETSWLERSGVWAPAADGYDVDPGERDDFTAREDHYGAMRTIPGRAVELRAAAGVGERSDVRALAKRLDAAAGEMAQALPLTLERPVRVVIEADHVVQGRYLGRIGEAVLSPEGAVHVVLHPDDEHAYLHAIGAALLERAGLAEKLPPWIADGAALWLSRQWYGRDWRQWLPRFAAARVLPSADQLLAKERQEDSSAPLWVPAAASLIDAAPGDTLRQKLSTLPGEAAVQAHLDRLAAPDGCPSCGAGVPPARAAGTAAPQPFFRGVSFAMLNRLDGGYHAPSVNERLARFAGLGANAVSLMPFAYQPAAGEPTLRFLNRSPTSETDVGVLHAARRARAAGFAVLWKPHIWLSHGSWPGEIEMKSDADWALWFASYRRYVAHHAFLAEWSGAELFSIGVELGKTLPREREWNELIAAVRWLFSGGVTYAGNWHSDYDRAPFWDRLDVLGVDAYFPLSLVADASPAALAEGARGVAERLAAASRRFGKPVLLTEIGYAARVAAWVEPHREGGTYSGEHQALAYRALFDALGRPPWLRGVFAWKAFSADRGGDAGTRADFRFLDRPAEAVLRDYFLPPDPASGPSASKVIRSRPTINRPE